MNDDRLEIYLNDHLGLLTGEIETAKRSRSENQHLRLGGILGQLVVELEEQRSALHEVFCRIHRSESRVKKSLGWLAEKVGRLKLNDSLTGYSPLSRLVELEALAVAALERVALWDNLEAVRKADPRLITMDFVRLREQAQQHLESLNAERCLAASEAFHPGRRCTPDTGPAVLHAQPIDEIMETTRLQITGMVCDACAGHVEKSLQRVAGVDSVVVDRAAGVATAKHVGAEDRELIAAVADAGYQAEVIQND